jgi:serine/threonine-protein kinase
MKYISGGDLASRLRNAPGGRIDEKTVTDWGMQVADVLQYLHGRPKQIIYRDLKPANLDADGGIFPDVDLDSDDPEAKVSRRHARITLRDGKYFLEDLGSTNGTFVNRGRRLLPGHLQPLQDGDEIILGKTFLRFQLSR